MTGYLTIGSDCYDVADRKAVSVEISRMRNIEFLVDLVQQCVLIPVGKKRCYIHQLVMIDLRLIAAPLQSLIGNKAQRPDIFSVF